MDFTSEACVAFLVGSRSAFSAFGSLPFSGPSSTFPLLLPAGFRWPLILTFLLPGVEILLGFGD